MVFTFEEVELLKQTMSTNNKIDFVKILDEFILYSDKELTYNIETLKEKISQLSYAQIEQLYNDRINYKLDIAPFYKL